MTNSPAIYQQQQTRISKKMLMKKLSALHVNEENYVLSY